MLPNYVFQMSFYINTELLLERRQSFGRRKNGDILYILGNIIRINETLDSQLKVEKINYISNVSWVPEEWEDKGNWKG